MTQTPAPTPAVPGDPVLRAQADIDAALAALEASRAQSTADQLVAAQRVHEVLAAHLAGRRPGEGA